MDSGDSVVSILQDRINALRLENASLRRKAAGPRSRKHAKHAVTAGQPTWTISSWLTSLQLMDIVAGCVYGSRPSDEVPDSQWVKQIGELDMGSAIDEALPKLKSKIMAEWKDLKNQAHVDALEMNDKFLADGSAFTFTYGDMELYHGGLERLVGQPHPDIMKRMAWEHKDSPYSSTAFENSTNGTSTAAREYDYVVHFSGEPENTDKGRDGYSIDTLWVHGTKSMDIIRRAGLQKAEVIALRLYTGPMYIWYNNILRFVRESLDSLSQWTPSHIRTWKEEGWTTPFTTTLHVLNSAIIKLSKTMKAFRVYRGTKGGILPPEFWKPNEMNVRGGIELGFMSTTLTRNVAMKFASSDESKPSLVFEIQMGMVDRGAPVQWCSQFPAEEEVLFAPLTGLEVVGQPRVEGNTMVVELRLNCNLHDLTIEQVTAKMKKTHFDLIHTIQLDMTMKGFSDDVMGPLLKHAGEHNQKSGQWFNNADKYKAATNAALQAKLDVCSTVLLTAHASDASKSAAMNVLFKSNDTAALAVGMKVLLQNERLLQQYQTTLATVADEADPSSLSDLKLDLKDLGLTSELPPAALKLMVWAESFDLSGNNFSNINPDSALAHMVYEMHRWRGAKMNWAGKDLHGIAQAAKLLYSCDELTISSVTLNVSELCRATALDLSGRRLGSKEALVVASTIPHNNVLMSISFDGTGDNGKAVKLESSMVEVDLSGKGLSSVGALITAAFLPNMTAMIKLDISSNMLIGDETSYIKKAAVVGDSLDVGMMVQYNGMRCAVTSHSVVLYGELKVIPIEGILALCDALNGNEVMQELNLAGTGLEPCSAKSLAQILPTMTAMMKLKIHKHELPIQEIKNATELDLSNKELNNLDAIVIAALLPLNDVLRSLDISKNNFGPDGAKTLAGVLPKCTALIKFTFSGDRYREYREWKNAPAVTLETDMAEVDISNQHLGVSGAIMAAAFLPKMTALIKFTFSGDEYRQGMYKTDAPPVTLETEMTEVDIGNKHLGASGAIMAAAFLSKMTALIKLDVSNNWLGSGGVKAFAGVLPKCKALTDLNVSENSFGVEGVKAFAGALPKCKALTKFNISGNYIDAEGAKALAGAIKKCSALIKFDISSNTLVGKETGYIKKAEVAGDSLDVGMMVQYNGMRCVVTKAVDSDGELRVRPIEGILAMCDALNGNEVMQEVNVAGIGLEPCSAKSLAQILPTMTALMNLDISGNNIPRDILDQMKSDNPRVSIKNL